MNLAGRGRVAGVVDYGAGNIRSIENALACLGARTRRLRSEMDFAGCTHVILPGVGAFGFCAARLHASGLIDRLRQWALEDRSAMLGICVGMQLLADASEESPEAHGLGWIGGFVQRLPAGAEIRIPHVGWNTVEFQCGYGEFARGSAADFYFDHSFACGGPGYGVPVGSCVHGVRFDAVIQRENITAAQFHPEKSQSAGMRFLSGFLRH
jgi:glutamine amidotransferase